MKDYTEIDSRVRVVKEVRCNKCGELIYEYQNQEKTDFLEVSKRWNYFSPFDNEVHNFHLCIDCYQAFVETFSIPLQDIQEP